MVAKFYRSICNKPIPSFHSHCPHLWAGFSRTSLGYNGLLNGILIPFNLPQTLEGSSQNTVLIITFLFKNPSAISFSLFVEVNKTLLPLKTLWNIVQAHFCRLIHWCSFLKPFQIHSISHSCSTSTFYSDNLHTFCSTIGF